MVSNGSAVCQTANGGHRRKARLLVIEKRIKTEYSDRRELRSLTTPNTRKVT
ncbi:Unannotated [Lentimonas sp. CC6]|nr:Unannotated [Lentimonas sp. CC6]CAA7170658.1 Unannotated [Lentimonas sp. CC21]CAA7182319.1 Unannotated [Lentimonas sp. CC8]